MALAIAALLTVVGFGVMLPNQVRVYRELVGPDTNVARVSRLGLRNAKLGGVQGALQLLVVFVMVNVRF